MVDLDVAAQQSHKTQNLMQKDPGKTKKTIIIDGIVYTANIHNDAYFTSKHEAIKRRSLWSMVVLMKAWEVLMWWSSKGEKSVLWSMTLLITLFKNS